MSKTHEEKQMPDYTPEFMPSKETQRAIYLAGLQEMSNYLDGLEKKVADDVTGELPTIGAIELLPLIKRAKEIIQELSTDEHIENEHELEISTELKNVTQEIASKSTQWAKQHNERVVGAVFNKEPVTTDAAVVTPEDWDKEAKQ